MAASILIALVFGAWSLSQYRADGQVLMLVSASGSLAAALGMFVYARWFLRKLRNVSYL